MKLQHLSVGIPHNKRISFCGCEYVPVGYLENPVVKLRSMTSSEYNDLDFRQNIAVSAPSRAERFKFATEPLGPPAVEINNTTLVYYYRLEIKSPRRRFRKL